MRIAQFGEVSLVNLAFTLLDDFGQTDMSPFVNV